MNLESFLIRYHLFVFGILRQGGFLHCKFRKKNELTAAYCKGKLILTGESLK